MQRALGCVRGLVAAALLLTMAAEQAWAWGAEGHRMINRLAGEGLPLEVPAFLRSADALRALAYYGPEPDRWRSVTEPELNAAQAPEHFIDLEYADLVGELPRRRYDFIRALAEAQKAHPDLPLTPEKVGLQPYETVELWERLKSAMRHYRGLEARKEETQPVEAEIVFLAGWMGHYVADGSMPLHTTIRYNGWTGPNPNGYTTGHRIHGQFEGEFVREHARVGEVRARMAGRPAVLGDVFPQYVEYLRQSNRLVERTYQIEKAGGFSGAGTAEGRAFATERLAAGATELRDLIYTAWVRSADPAPEYRE